MKLIIATLAVLLFNLYCLDAQFDIEAYKEYLKSHKDMTVDELLQEYPAGLFLKEAPTNLYDAKYGDTIDIKYRLTDYEKDLISKHGFMVTERLKFNNFIHAFKEIYYNDLPVYISSDAILSALHYSFDNILKSVENKALISRLDKVLSLIYNEIPEIMVKSGNPEYTEAINDLDVFITVARKLLADSEASITINPIINENQKKINEILDLISKKQRADVYLFSEHLRPLDFSQFEPRGHYTDPERLTAYFQTMIWLGRSELYITAPKQHLPIYQQSEGDIKRQNILSALLAEAANNSGAIDVLRNLESILEAFLGRQDNISIFEASNVLEKLGEKDANWVSENDNWKIYQDELLKLNSSNQLYNSQIIYSDITLPEQVEPPASMMLFGQRAILDGYITANVVFDRIMYDGKKVTRMIPSTLDILFALGNDAAIQLLEPELRTYPYSANLASLRYLIEGYDNSFWNSSCYTIWLSAIKALNPPKDRTYLPKFMQTAAWWQKTMNTQLASWSQLRHDFLLYAKQPYSSGGAGCIYPDCFVEPVPEVFDAIKLFITNIDSAVNMYDYEMNKVIEKFNIVCTNLSQIATKELQGIMLDSSDMAFVNSLINRKPDCVPAWKGWYMDLLYGIGSQSYDAYASYPKDFTVADVHTIPTDKDGNEMGWVLHGGTGRINIAVIVNERPDGEQYAYIGPVMSYYETITNNYKRLTDQEWVKYHTEENSNPPALTNLYIANDSGEEKFNKVSLNTVLTDVKDESSISKLYLKNYPNPFDDHTYIDFSVPPEYSYLNVQLVIYDIEGNLINTLINKALPVGNYSIVWGRTALSGMKMKAGAYVYSLKIGDIQETGKMVLITKD
ncbi:DUF3160 domain-containing protein [Bacteroidota bacterium]